MGGLFWTRQQAPRFLAALGCLLKFGRSESTRARYNSGVRLEHLPFPKIINRENSVGDVVDVCLHVGLNALLVTRIPTTNYDELHIGLCMS